MAAAIPLRCCPNQTGVEVMLVNSRRGAGCVFPKGEIDEDDLCARNAAKREAMEEAGVRGELLDVFDYRAQYVSRRVKRKGIHPDGLCDAQCFVMTVTEEMDTWPEMERRQRQWYPLDEAKERCKHTWMQDALCEVEERLPDIVSTIDSMNYVGLEMWETTGITVEVRKEQDTDAAFFHFS